MKTSTQIKSEHPDWTDEQVAKEFETLMDKDAKSIGRKLRKMKKILDTDPISRNDDGYKFWADMFKDAANLADPDLSGFGIMDLDEEETEEFFDRVAKFNQSKKSKGKE